MINHGTIGLGVLAFVVTGAAATVLVMARSADSARSLTYASFKSEPEAAKGSAAFRERELYTPQMVVNGSQEFVGSDSSTAKSAIKKALAQAASVEVAVRAKESSQDTSVKAGGKRASKRIVVTSSLKSDPKGAVARVALTESGLSTDVKRGENSGRALKHDAVVRAFTSIKNPVDGETVTELTPPDGFDVTKARVVVFVQDVSSMKVFGASESEVSRDR